MRNIFGYAGVLIFALCTNMQASVNTVQVPVLKKQAVSLEAFVPRGWKLIKKTSGRLDRSGCIFAAGVIEMDIEYNRGSDNAPVRILFIAFKKSNGLYRLSLQTSKAVLKADEGGIWGDPFNGIFADKGLLVISFYGGSNFRWAYTYSFMFKDNSWYLIKATIENFHTGSGIGTKNYYNLLNGIVVKSNTRLGKTVKSVTIKRGKKKLLNIQNFNASSGERQL
jgi:hypothetical protein